MTNTKVYRHGDWFAFRQEILVLDGFICRRCGRGEAEDVVLQVHHKRYIPGLKPWEYAYKDCETICKGCHAEAHGKVIPKSGWEYQGQDDLGDLSGGCEYCGNNIRYIFHIYHSHWGSLVVGTICCNTLTHSDSASVYARLQGSREARAERFVESPRWRIENGIFKIKQKQFAVQIIRVATGYKIVMNNTLGRQVFEKLIAAKLKVYEVIESGVAEKYFKNPRPSGPPNPH